MAKLVINENKTEGHINPEIYGHFSEHLCRFRCCAGRADALRTSITGKTVSGRKKTAKR